MKVPANLSEIIGEANLKLLRQIANRELLVLPAKVDKQTNTRKKERASLYEVCMIVAIYTGTESIRLKTHEEFQQLALTVVNSFDKTLKVSLRKSA